MNSEAELNSTEEDRARAEVYHLLGLLLAAPPGEEVLARLRGIEVPEGAEGAEMPDAWQGLRSAAQTAEPASVEREFQNLFIGLGRGELSPYMSSYLTGYLMERPLAELRAELARLGYARQEAVKEPEDHAAAICEVMAMILVEDRLSFEKSGLFFDRFLRPWIGDFFRDLAAAQSARFYRSVGNLGVSFMRVENRFYSMSV